MGEVLQNLNLPNVLGWPERKQAANKCHVNFKLEMAKGQRVLGHAAYTTIPYHTDLPSSDVIDESISWRVATNFTGVFRMTMLTHALSQRELWKRTAMCHAKIEVMILTPVPNKKAANTL